jgi:hypothetical protein
MKHNFSILNNFIPVLLLHENPFMKEKTKAKENHTLINLSMKQEAESKRLIQFHDQTSNFGREHEV